jgi:putative ATP-dependent endonuclease of OLD family
MESLSAQLHAEARTAQDAEIRPNVATCFGDLSSIPDYVRHLLAQIAAIKVLYLRERRREIARAEAKRLLDLKNQRQGAKRFQSIKQLVESLLGVPIDVFNEQSAQNAEAEPEIDVDSFLLDVNGSGIREALRIILDVEFEKPSILLVEEPEVYLHPALETAMMSYLRQLSNDVQLFLSTHSTNFLDRAEMGNVYLVSKKESTSVRLSSLDEAEAQIPEELGLRLSSVFMFDRLVFVEGPSDESIIRHWASTLRVNLSNATVGFIKMGGVRNFTHFAANSTLEFLTKRQVRMWFILDRDEKETDDIKALVGSVTSARVTTLGRRQIENYLLCPRALTKFLNERLAESGQTAQVTEDIMASLIDQKANALKDLSVAKRVTKLACRPLYPLERTIFAEGSTASYETAVESELVRLSNEVHNLKDSIPRLSQEQQQIVEREWNSRKLDIVPGALLLDGICKEFGLRFRKTRDGARIAAKMTSHEISDDIENLIGEIGGTL